MISSSKSLFFTNKINSFFAACRSGEVSVTMSSIEQARQACEDIEAYERAVMDQLDVKPKTTKVSTLSEFDDEQ